MFLKVLIHGCDTLSLATSLCMIAALALLQHAAAVVVRLYFEHSVLLQGVISTTTTLTTLHCSIRWDPLCGQVKGAVARIQRSAAVRCAAHMLLGLVLQQVFFCGSYSSNGFSTGSFFKAVLTALHAVTVAYLAYLAAAAHHV
jgi:hypothetical protein